MQCEIRLQRLAVRILLQLKYEPCVPWQQLQQGGEDLRAAVVHKHNGVSFRIGPVIVGEGHGRHHQ